MNVSDVHRDTAIGFAKSLVNHQVDPRVRPYDRLWDIARNLNVSRIEAGATRSQGCVKQLSDGSFAVYYSSNVSIQRRRYTVAHELSHLVLERFVPHITPENTVARQGKRNTRIERVVDRIAAELLLPERMVVSALREICQRQKSRDGRIDKRSVVTQLRQWLGVSESAMLFRLIELPELLAVIVRVMMSDAPPRFHGVGNIIQKSDEAHFRILNDLLDFSSENFPSTPSEIQIETESHLGKRTFNCDGWMRELPFENRIYHEYWIVGWTWNANPAPEYDDTT